MSRGLKERVRIYIAQHGMIRESDVVCVGCSGGADSTLLLVLLCEFRAEHAFGFPFSVTACHVNHHLRGDESDGDEQYVRELCRRLGVPLWCAQEDVGARAERTGTGLEEAGREARIGVFRECLKNRKATKIALAHHADDQAETVLYHLARGAALAGLSGMRPVNGRVIRPFLQVPHREICAELEKRGIHWRTDSSNESYQFARNRIRRVLIPELERDVNEGASRHIAGAAEMIRMADDFIAQETKVRAEKYVRVLSGEDAACADGAACRRGVLRVCGALLSEPEIIRRSVLMDCLCTLAERRKDIGRVHVESLLDLFGRETGKRIELPYGIRAFRIPDGIVIAGADAGYTEPEREEFSPAVTAKAEPVRITKSGIYRFGDVLIEAEIMRRGEIANSAAADSGKCGSAAPERGAEHLCVPQKTYTKWLNYDKIKKGLLIRNRIPGDYLTLDDGGRKQKLKNYFINSKIGRDYRDRIILLAEDSHVYWAVGGRISAAAKIGPDTERVIRIEVIRTDGNGGSVLYG